jgi:hypothetical protein
LFVRACGLIGARTKPQKMTPVDSSKTITIRDYINNTPKTPGNLRGLTESLVLSIHVGR